MHLKMHQLLFPALLCTPAAAFAATPDGSQLSLIWGLPFVLILLSIATGPLFFAHTWHHHFGKITALWTLLFLIPFTLVYGVGAGWVPSSMPLWRNTFPSFYCCWLYTPYPAAFWYGATCTVRLKPTRPFWPSVRFGLGNGYDRRGHAHDPAASESQRQPQTPRPQRHLLYFPRCQHRRRTYPAGRPAPLPRLPQRRGLRLDGCSICFRPSSSARPSC
ncbi:Uncharacterised protein [Kingella potus]|uniref:Uncharacterized protein n=1 Tax=Kingella potus TaxID=265175 RepID=A0A377R4J6_9NEIS|nr:Uncharacterised protein [Kingella potus]